MVDKVVEILVSYFFLGMWRVFFLFLFFVETLILVYTQSWS